MLEPGATTGCASSVATVGAEFAGRIASLPGQGCIGKYFPDRIPCPDITHRIGAGRLANWRLIHKDHVAELLGSHKPMMLSGCFSGLAEMAHQGRCEHILDQRGLARAANTCHTHQPLKWNLYADVFEVVLGDTFKNKSGRVSCDKSFETRAHLLAPTQIGTGQRVSPSQVLR